MKKHWWKAFGTLILLYTFIAGMLVPLKPGIVQCHPNHVEAGQSVNLSVKGYNSHFQQAGKVRAWLKLNDKEAIAAQNVIIKNDRKLQLDFVFPTHLPVKKAVQDFSLILDNELDGASVLPSAVFAKQNEIDSLKGATLWNNAPIENLHEKSGITFPFRNILSETIRNTYFHVPLWFSMFILFIAAVVMSIKYLNTYNADYDKKAKALTSVGILFGILGLVTGAVWAKHTWGAYWSFDIKQNMSAIAMLIYGAYFVLRNSFEDPEKQARIGAVYNIFAFATLVPLLYVIPRLVDSLHPGSGGNPALGGEDLDHTMGMVFYPAIIGWTLLGVWMAQVSYRASKLEERLWGS